MLTKSWRSIGLLTGTILTTFCLLSLKASGPPGAKQVDFSRDIYPLLKARCFKCHQGADASSGVRLDLRAEVLGDTNGKPLAHPGHAARSRLIELVSGTAADKKVMPPRGQRLTAAEVDLLRSWIEQGLKWDDKLLPPLTAPSHWAFRPVVCPKVPKVQDAAWVRNPIDAFISAQHEKRGLTPAPEASRRVLIRRLSLDLTGLPPTPAEVDAFLADRSASAYENLVERLLTSPHHGERWARHWLDVARWAESEGYESNHLRPYAWRYRDYVVRSFNSDKPYDRFLREQLAGDEMAPYADENLIAMGFLAAARLSSNEEDRPRQRNDIYVDIVNATSSALLGLTMNCAQCHNHKFDPISARDYYRFQGFFVKGQPVNVALRDPGLWQAYTATRPPEYEPAKKLQHILFEGARTRLIEKVKKKLSPEARQALDTPDEQRTAVQDKLAREAESLFQFGTGEMENAILPEDAKLYVELKKKVAALEQRMPNQPHTFAFYSPATSPTKVDVLPMKGFYPLPFEPKTLARARPYLLVAGDAHQRGVPLDVGWPAIFGPVPKGATDKTPRLALADWLASPKNPLTARVYVNRLWQYHFGRGLVETSSDFGVKGTPPTHPELLDWLAAEFMRSGWSTRHLHRLIVCSSTYRQSSANNEANAKVDPDNTAWWHWQPRRLEAEAIRDSMLAVSGELRRQAGGPSEPADGKSLRRSLYLLQKRENPPPLAGLFDLPAAAAESCARRYVSTVPLQALYLLNNEFATGRGKAFAGRAFAQAGKDQERQVESAFLLALGRGPDEVEREAARRFFEAHTADSAGVGGTPPALVDFCQALLNLNEFVYLE
jgi:hypothetical protein